MVVIHGSGSVEQGSCAGSQLKSNARFKFKSNSKGKFKCKFRVWGSVFFQRDYEVDSA